MPMIPGLGKSASYVLDALGGTAEKASARVAAKAETKAGRRYLKKLANTRAGRSADTVQLRRQSYNAAVNDGPMLGPYKDPTFNPAPSYFPKGSNQGVLRPDTSEDIAKRRQRVALSKTPGPSRGTRGSDPAFRARYRQNKMMGQAAVAMRRETAVRRGSLAVGLGGVGMISGRGPNESRTSYRGPGRTPGLRNSVGTGRYA